MAGFQTGETIIHKKMGVELDLTTLERFEAAGELEEYVKELLRNQCFLRK